MGYLPHPFKPGQSAHYLNLSCPPGDDAVTFIKQSRLSRLWLRYAEWDERAGIPISVWRIHRPSRSSRQTCSITSLDTIGPGGSGHFSPFTRGTFGGVTIPLAMRRRIRASSSSTGPGETSRATGVFRSRISTSSPFLTNSIWALSLAFNSLIFAVRIGSLYHNMTNLVALYSEGHWELMSEPADLFIAIHNPALRSIRRNLQSDGIPSSLPAQGTR